MAAQDLYQDPLKEQQAPQEPGLQAQPAGPDPNDPFAAMGGGTNVNGNWIPNSNPAEIARQQGLANPVAAPGATPGAAGANPPPTTYDATPNMQEMQRNAIIDQITKAQQPVNTQDPAFRQQADTYAATQERARRNASDALAERMGPNNSGALQTAQRMASERAAQSSAGYEAGLLGEQRQQKREDLARYLEMNKDTISEDQQQALQRELAQLDAQLRREGYGLQGQLGNRELDIRNDLGNKGLQNDIMRMLLSNKQFGQDLGFRIGSKESDVNRDAILAAMGL